MAAGRGYFSFATKEPGLFGCLTGGSFQLDSPENENRKQETDDPAPSNPFETLVGLVTRTGVSPEREKNHAPLMGPKERAIVLWASVHGIAALCSIGTLRDLPEERKQELLELTLRAAVKGVTGIDTGKNPFSSGRAS